MKAFDLLALVARFAQQNKLALNDPALVDKFFAEAAPSLKTALSDPTLIHGARTERMFEAMFRFQRLPSPIPGGSRPTVVFFRLTRYI